MLVLAVLVAVLGAAFIFAGSVFGYVSGGALLVAGVLLYRQEHRRRRAPAVAAPVLTAAPKRPFWQRAAIGFTGFVCVAAIIVTVVFRLTAGMTAAADGFFTAGKVKDLARAKTYLAEDFRASTSDAQLTAFFESSTLSRYQSSSWSNRSIQNGRGELDGEFRTDTGGVVPMKIGFVKEAGQWKIYSLKKPEAGLSSEIERRAVPPPEEQRRLVKATIHSFADAVARRNYGEFHSSISGLWQRQLTVEALGGLLKPFVDSGDNFLPLDQRSPTIESAAVDDAGLLVLAGRYPLDSQFTFKTKYLYEGIDWKPAGFDLHVGAANKDGG